MIKINVLETARFFRFLERIRSEAQWFR